VLGCADSNRDTVAGLGRDLPRLAAHRDGGCGGV
jgi:hypothetical protein